LSKANSEKLREQPFLQAGPGPICASAFWYGVPALILEEVCRPAVLVVMMVVRCAVDFVKNLNEVSEGVRNI